MTEPHVTAVDVKVAAVLLPLTWLLLRLGSRLWPTVDNALVELPDAA